MRVLFLAYANFGQDFGATRHMIELLNALAEGGVDVTLPVAAMWQPSESVRFRVVRYFCPNVRFVRGVWSRLALARIAARAGLWRQVDVLYSRDPVAGWIYGLAARIARVPLVTQVVGFVDEQSEDSGEHRLHRGVVSLGQRFTLKTADRVIATSEGIRARIIRDFGRSPEDVAMVPRGIDLTIARPRADAEACRVRLGIEGDPVLVYVGSLIRWQGVEVAIASMPQILARHPRAKLVIVGPHNPLSKKLVAQAADLRVGEQVLFPGGVPLHRAVEYINAADVCLAPYSDARLMQHAPTSDKVLTYLACARPVVVSTALLQHAEDVRHLKLGEVCSPDDPVDFARAALRVIDNRSSFLERGDELRRYAEQWSWEPVASSTRKFLADACSSVSDP